MTLVMDIFDYNNMLIHFDGYSYPFTIITEGYFEHIISTQDLNVQLFEEGKGDYPSLLAQWIDEQITYFVMTEKDLLRPAEDLLKEIYG